MEKKARENHHSSPISSKYLRWGWLHLLASQDYQHESNMMFKNQIGNINIENQTKTEYQTTNPKRHTWKQTDITPQTSSSYRINKALHGYLSENKIRKLLPLQKLSSPSGIYRD